MQWEHLIINANFSFLPVTEHDCKTCDPVMEVMETIDDEAEAAGKIKGCTRIANSSLYVSTKSLTQIADKFATVTGM